MTPRSIIYLTLLLLFGGVGVVWLFQKKLSAPFTTIVAFIVLVFLGEVLAKYFAFQYHNNFPIYHIISWCHLLLLGHVYFSHFTGTLKRYVGFTVAVGLAGCLFFSIFTRGMLRFPIENLAILTVIGIGCALFHFRTMLKYPKLTPLNKEPMFWINAVHLIFFGITFFSFQYLTTPKPVPLWDLYLLFSANVCLYSAYFTAVLLSKAKPL